MSGCEQYVSEVSLGKVCVGKALPPPQQQHHAQITSGITTYHAGGLLLLVHSQYMGWLQQTGHTAQGRGHDSLLRADCCVGPLASCQLWLTPSAFVVMVRVHTQTHSLSCICV